MAQSGSGKKVANSLVAVSTAAVLAVYAAGYARTRSAAERLDEQSAERRPAQPVAAVPVPAAAPVYDWARDEGRTPPRIDPAPTSVPASPAAVPASSAATAPVVNAQPGISAPKAPEPESKPDAPPPVLVSSTVPAPVPPPLPPPVSAPEPITPPAATPPAPKWKDGTYTGWGTSRHGDIQAEVLIEGGRIVSAKIAQCLTRYSCDVIGRLPPEVPQRQSAEVDYVSGATQSTNAYYYAVLEALGKAK